MSKGLSTWLLVLRTWETLGYTRCKSKAGPGPREADSSRAHRPSSPTGAPRSHHTLHSPFEEGQLGSQGWEGCEGLPPVWAVFLRVLLGRL